MIAKQDLIYRQLVTLRDGARVLLRPLTTGDRQALIDLFAPISAQERGAFRTNVSDPAIVGAWVDMLDYDRVLPLVAVIGDRIVGDATLHFHQGPKRHIAEVRIFLAKDFRQRGLGSRMLTAIIDIAKKRNLYMLEVEVVNDQTNIIRAFQSAGFYLKCVFEEYFMLPDGELKDQAHLVMRLRTKAVGSADDF
ncbi:MAG: GNAT family N-acetyltransferase [Chloroflexota bacterium]|nr:MAG: GNAT family N-acetyltransferase [Chloroflexota bacterium]